MDRQAHEIGGGEHNVHFATLNQARNSGGKPGRQKRWIGCRLEYLKHEVKIAATCIIVQP